MKKVLFSFLLISISVGVWGQQLIPIDIRFPSAAGVNDGKISVMVYPNFGQTFNYQWYAGGPWGLDATKDHLPANNSGIFYMVNAQPVGGGTTVFGPSTLMLYNPPVISSTVLSNVCGYYSIQIDDISGSGGTNFYYPYIKKMRVKFPDNHFEDFTYSGNMFSRVFPYGGTYEFSVVIFSPWTGQIVSESNIISVPFIGSYPTIKSSIDSAICEGDLFIMELEGGDDVRWDFNNDGTDDALGPYVSYSFPMYGTYISKVSFVQQGCGVVQNEYKVIHVNPTGQPPFQIDPVIEYLSPLNPCPGDIVQFHLKKTPSLNISWYDLNDKILSKPDSYYNGDINIDDTKTNDNASSTDPIIVSVNACGLVFYDTAYIPFTNNAPIDPNAFGYTGKDNPIFVCPETPVEFKIDELNVFSGNYKYTWNFGGGDVVQSPVVYRSFSSPSNVVLNVKNNCQNNANYLIAVNTNPDPASLPPLDTSIFNIKTATDKVCSGDQLLFTIKNLASSYVFDFGDGTSQTIANSTEDIISIFHAFSTTSDVTITITNDCGQVAIWSKTITVQSGLTPYNSGNFEKDIYWKQGDELTHPIPLIGAIEGCTPTRFATVVPGNTFDWTFTKLISGDTLGQIIGSTSPDIIFSFDSVRDVKAYVTVHNGCSRQADFEGHVWVNPAVCVGLNVNVNVTQPTCANPKGLAVASLSSAAPTGVSYTYEWNDNGHTFNDSLPNLDPGTYRVTVNSNTGEKGYGIAVVNPIAGEYSLSTTTTNSTCNLTDGSATVNVAGTVSSPTYTWSNGVSGSNTLNNVSAGIYAVTVTSGACSKFAIAKVEDNSSFSISNSTVTDVTCHDAEDGQIELDFTGVAGNVSVFWSSGHSGALIHDLKAGAYFAQATNEFGCKAFKAFVLPNPDPIAIDSVTVSAPSPCGTATGIATLHVSGATSYSHIWSDEPAQTYSGTVRAGLSVGVYSVTITSGACSTEDLVYVDELPVEISKLDQTAEDCGLINGALNARMVLSNLIDYNLDSVSWVSPSYSPWDQPTSFQGNSISNSDWTSIPHGIKTAIAYGVTSSDPANVCKSYRHMFLPSVKPQPVEICLVTVNDSNQNVVVWDTTSVSGVEKYLIYREDFLSGDFDKIKEVGTSTEFTDKYSDASVKSYRYRMAVKDVCGGVSDLTAWHRAAHLTVTKDAATNEIHMNFQPYWGFNYDTLKIWADTTGVKPYTWFEVTSLSDPSGVIDSFYFFLSDPNYSYLQNAVSEGRLRLACDYPKADGACSSAKAENRNSGRSNTDKCCPDALISFYADVNIDDETTLGSCDGEALLTVFGGTAPYTYQWSDGVTTTDNPRQGLCSGDYTVTVTDALAMHATVDVTISAYVGIQAMNNKGLFRVYPNPTTGTLFIESVEGSPVLGLKLYNLSGALVLNTAVENTHAQIQTLSLATLPAGVYHLELSSAEGVNRYLVVKE